MSDKEIDRLELTGQLRAALDGLMEWDRYSWNEKGVFEAFGHLSGPADQLYRPIRMHLESLGFTPFLRREGNQDVLTAMPGIMQGNPPRVGLPIVLFILTVISSTLIGALNANPDCITDFGAAIWKTLTTPQLLAGGLPFAGTLLGILLAHEMGHYIVGRMRKAPVSLPYFIPLPPPLSFTGTMGAVIVQREPMEDRRTILEIGLAGPFAGMVLAIPLLIYGLMTSPVGPPPAPPPGCPAGYIQEGNSLLYAGMKYLVYGRVLPSEGQDVQLNQIAWGAWIGLLVTMLNLLPVGQFDGGHAAYALLGRRADMLAYTVIGLCIALGVTFSQTWLVWGILTLLIGPRHPPPLNDISPLSWGYKAFAIAGLLLFVLLFMPVPILEVTP